MRRWRCGRWRTAARPKPDCGTGPASAGCPPGPVSGGDQRRVAHGRRDGAAVVPLQCRRPRRLAGPAARGAAGDVPAGAGGRVDCCQSDQPAGPRFVVWQLDVDRLTAYLMERGIAIKRSRIGEILQREACAGGAGTWFGDGRTPPSPQGAIVRLYTAAPEGSVVVCLDVGPERPRAFLERGWCASIRTAHGGPARQSRLWAAGRGYVFGAFVPATGPP